MPKPKTTKKKKWNILESSFVIPLEASVRDAMGAITDNQRGAVILVGTHGRLHGILSDGDIRRAMLSGFTLETPVEKIANMHPVTLTASERNKGKGEEIFEKETSITLLPVVGSKNELLDVVIREPKKRKPW